MRANRLLSEPKSRTEDRRQPLGTIVVASEATHLARSGRAFRTVVGALEAIDATRAGCRFGAVIVAAGFLHTMRPAVGVSQQIEVEFAAQDGAASQSADCRNPARQESHSDALPTSGRMSARLERCSPPSTTSPVNPHRTRHFSGFCHSSSAGPGAGGTMSSSVAESTSSITGAGITPSSTTTVSISGSRRICQPPPRAL